MGEGNFWPNPHSFINHQKFVASDYVGDLYGRGTFGANLSTGGFWANGWYITNLFIYTFFISWTHLRPVDGFSRLMAQTTRTCARMCLFGVSLILFLILQAKYPQNPSFWGMNRRFQAKRAKYCKFHVIETIALILTKFGTTIETIKWSSWVVPIGT